MLTDFFSFMGVVVDVSLTPVDGIFVSAKVEAAVTKFAIVLAAEVTLEAAAGVAFEAGSAAGATGIAFSPVLLAFVGAVTSPATALAL